MHDTELADQLTRWIEAPASQPFPLDQVIATYRRTGKHFVDAGLLQRLDAARQAVAPDDATLARFLDTALDKFDRRFDNPSYLALHDLPLPSTAGRCPLETAAAVEQRDRLTALLVADTLRFELDALDGKVVMPLLLPPARTIAKRCAIGVRLLRTLLPRLGIAAGTETDDPVAAARVLCARVEASHADADRRMLEVTFLPVFLAHDEHMFIRMLQAYETSFALVVVELRAAIIAIRARMIDAAVRSLERAARVLGEISPCFSLVATMQPEAFMAFREFTDGASAIQSRSYKEIESLCRRPVADRLHGPGYDAVPEVRERVLSGRLTMAEVVDGAAGLSAEQTTALRAAMDRLEAEILGWRKTHYNLATRMLGLKRGTGYTEGVPYLAEGTHTPVFGCPFGHGQHHAEAADESEPVLA